MDSTEKCGVKRIEMEDRETMAVRLPFLSLTFVSSQENLRLYISLTPDTSNYVSLEYNWTLLIAVGLILIHILSPLTCS